MHVEKNCLIGNAHSLFLHPVIKKEVCSKLLQLMCPPTVKYFYVFFFSIQLYKEIEICQKITQHIQIEKSDASSDIYGKYLSSVCFYLPTKSIQV